MKFSRGGLSVFFAVVLTLSLLAAVPVYSVGNANRDIVLVRTADHDELAYLENKLGYTGAGVVIAVADTGIAPDHPDFQDRVIGGYSYTDDGSWHDGHGSGTYMALIAAGNGSSAQGPAPEALLFAVKVFSDFGAWVGPSDVYEIVQVSKEYGEAQVLLNAWGVATNGAYGIDASRYDAGVRDFDMVISATAGNSGPGYTTIGEPATGKNVICVGAYDNDFSSRGWTQDNRIKPDVVSSGDSGTSTSCARVSGLSAVIIEWYEDNYNDPPSPAMVKALLINTAIPIEYIPNRDEGWGIADISKFAQPMEEPVPFYLSDQEHVFTGSGQTNEHTVKSDREGEPLKFNLVWTDKEAPGNTGSGPALINDLNIIIESPSGLIYRGNAFTDGWSVAGADAMPDFDRNGDGWDDTNNVECVYIHPDDVELGDYTVTIEARTIAGDAVGVGYNSQDYALVVYNAEEPISTETFDIPLYAGGDADGWNFVSFNLVPLDVTLESILENETYGISGSYDRLMYYDASADEWKSYVPGRAGHFNNLHSWNHRMGIWIRMTTTDTLTVEGYVPTSTDITLYPGWNMVGLPSSTSGNHELPSEVTIVGYFDATAEYNLAYDHNPETFVFEPGKGYWLYNSADEAVVWTVEY